MSKYHPLDVRYKGEAKSLTSQSARLRYAALSESTDSATKPWKFAKEQTPAWEKTGPIKDDLRVERKMREKLKRAIENDELNRSPLAANLFSPAALFYQFRAKYRSERAMGTSIPKFGFQIVAAIMLYFGLVYTDRIFDINALLTNSISNF